MNKKKNCRLSLSKGAVIGCLIAIAAFSSIGVNAFATESASQTEQTKVVQNATDQKFLIDSDYKNYGDLKKAAKVAGFDFKVPDYAVNGYTVDEGIDVCKLSDTENYVSLTFDNQDENSDFFSYSIDVYKGNPKEALKKIYKDYNNETVVSKSDITSSEKTIGNVKGEDITIITESSYGADNEKNKDIDTYKCFAWEDNGLYYAVNYSDIEKHNDGKEEQYVNVKEDDIVKIINSMKKPEDVTNVKYFSDLNFIHVYDNEDLDAAVKALGFTPKFISSINNELKISFAVAYNNRKAFAMTYKYDNKDGNKYHISLAQTKDSSDYNNIKNGNFKFNEDRKPSKAEKLTINNKEVYKVVEDVSKIFEADKPQYDYAYIWEDNGIYYKFSGFSEDSSFGNTLESAIKDILNK